MVLIQLLLPIVDGAEAAISETRRELAERFDGLTAYLRSPASGWWAASDGRQERDEVVMVEVVTAAFDRTWWGSYAKTLATRFKQETIHVRALAVELLEDEPAGARN